MMYLEQGFSALDFRHLGPKIVVGVVPCLTGFLAASLTTTQWPATLPASCNNQKCVLGGKFGPSWE